MFSVIPVALYSTLGHDACEYIINQSKFKTNVPYKNG